MYTCSVITCEAMQLITHRTSDKSVHQYWTINCTNVHIHNFQSSTLSINYSINQPNDRMKERLFNCSKDLTSISEPFKLRSNIIGELKVINYQSPPITKFKEIFKNGGSDYFTINLQL